MVGPDTLPAGDFSSWLEDMRAALRGERAAEVPCDACTACCTSSQFVHVEPDESDALAHIPRQFLFPAPGLPRGHLVMGYDERGHCPMLVDRTCSIYEHRPRTCRSYDCRIFPATGIEPDKEPIAAQARRWEFTYPTGEDRLRHEALRAAAGFVRGRSPTEIAVRAVQHHPRPG